MSDLEVRIHGDPTGAVDAFVKVGHGAQEMAGDIVREAAQMVAAFFTIEKAIEGLREGIAKADEIRDLSLSIGVLSGSMDRGVESMEFFRKKSEETRNTGEELAHVYRDILPMAMARGFSRESAQQITVWLSQLATVAGSSVDEMEQSFQRALYGRVPRGGNALTRVLGITKLDVDNMGWDTLISKIEEVSNKFPQFGQSWESTMHKAKEDMLETFAEGFNEARGSTETGMAGVKQTLSELKPLVHGIGVGVAEASEHLKDAVGLVREIKTEFTVAKDVLQEINTGPIRDFTALLTGKPGEGSFGQILLLLYKMSPQNLMLEEAKLPFRLLAQHAASTEEDNARQASATQAHRRYGVGDFMINGAMPPTGWRFGEDWGAGDPLRPTADGGGGVYPLFARTVGALSEKGSSAQIAIFFKEINKALDDHVLKTAEVRAAWQTAVGPTKDAIAAVHEEAAKLGKIKIDPDNSGKALHEFAQILSAATRLDLELRKLADDSEAAVGIANARLPQTAIALEYERDLVKVFDQDAIQREKIAALQDKLTVAVKIYGALSPETAKIRFDLHAATDDLDRFTTAGQKLADINLNKRLGELFNQGAFMQQFRLDFPRTGPEYMAHFAQQDVYNTMADRDRQTLLAAQAAGTWATSAELFGKYFRQQDLGKHMADQFRSSLSSALLDFAQTGGKNFGQIAGQFLASEMQTGIDGFMANIFGRAGDSRLLDTAASAIANREIRQDPNLFYDSRGNPVSDTRVKVGQGLLAGAGIALTGYQAGLSGQSGARTGAIIEGAVSGAAVAGVAGAIVGAIGAAIAGAIGAAQKQADYKYGIPSIVDGTAQFTGARNITASEQRKIIADLQEIYDSIHDSLVLTLAKIPGAIIPGRGNLGGAIQPNPSAHFMEHLSLFETGDLTRAAMGEFNTELTNTATLLGMSASRFGEIWHYLQGIDPKKAVGLIDTLFSALEEQHTLSNYWGGSDLRHATSPISNDRLDFANNALWWGQTESKKTLASNFTDIDAQILQLSGSLSELSEAGRIQTFQQIVGLEKQRDDMLKQAAMELYNLAKSVKDESSSDLETLDIQGLRKPDGSPDNAAIADYWKKRAEQDLFTISSATNPSDARAAWEKFRHDVNASWQAGIAASGSGGTSKWDDPTMAGLKHNTSADDIIKWAQGYLGLGQKEIDKAVIRFGGSIDDINADFNSKLDPAINDFTTKVDKTSGKFDDIGGAIDRTIDPIDRLHKNSDSAADSLATLTSAVGDLADRINRLTFGGGGTKGGTGLTGNTLAQRYAA